MSDKINPIFFNELLMLRDWLFMRISCMLHDVESVMLKLRVDLGHQGITF